MLVGYDCGGIFVDAGLTFNFATLTEAGKLFELLERGYAQSPDGESYEAALSEQLDPLPVVDAKAYPNIWNAAPGDILAFDMSKGKTLGIQHIALISKITPMRFHVIHATRDDGVNEAPLAPEWQRGLVGAYRIRGIE